MIWFLAALAALIILPILLLIPKVHFSGEASPGRIFLELRGLAFRLSYDNRADDLTGRFLFFKRRPDSASKRSQADDGSSTVVPEPTPQSVAQKKITIGFKPPSQSGDTKTGGKFKVRVKVSSWGGLNSDVSLAKLLAGRLFRLLKRLLKSIRADYIRAELTVATPDPMWTAVLFGALQPVAAFNRPPRREFHVGVDFERESPRVSASWAFSARPIRWLWIVVSWLFGLPWIRIWHSFRSRD